MKIVVVIDYFGKTTNGTTMTARHLVSRLRAKGHDVRVLTGVGNDWEGVYETGIDKGFLPLYWACKAHGFIMAKVNWKIIKEALEGADVVHFLTAFHFSRRIKIYCDKHGIATTSAFHVQPENITSSVYLGKWKALNSWIYKLYKDYFYRKFDVIHCPSQMIANQLTSHGYKAELKVISNGIAPKFHPIEAQRPEEYKDYYLIAMVGRISREKRQDLLIKAIAHSKYADKIKLLLPGSGPWLMDIRNMAKKYLKNEAYIGWMQQEDLIKVLNYLDLYVHASDVEIEAISCMEAFACGRVPVISDSPISATSQFALTENNKFKAGDYKDLSAKIDYWIEHEEEKKALSKQYVEYAKQYAVDKCVDQLENMLIEEYNKKHV